MLIFFQLFSLSIGYFIYKPFTSIQSGPCDTSNNILQIPNSLLGPAYSSFTVGGWFKKDSLLSTSKNLLFLFGPDTNNYANFHLAATLNEQFKVQSCYTTKDCMTSETSELMISDVDDRWIYVLVSINFAKKLLHYKLVTHSDTLPRIYIYSSTLELKTIPTFTDTTGIVIKNKVVSLYNFNGFCGKFKEFTYYGNLYTETSRQAYNFDVEYITYWMTLLPSTTSALNALSSTQDVGTLIGGVTFDAKWGWQFQKNQYSQFNNLRSSFGDKFMISVNVFISNPNSEMNFLYRADQNLNPLVQIRFISSSSTFNVQVQIGGVVGEAHGQISAPMNTWIPMLFSVYNNFNFYPENANPGMALFDIITPSFQEYGKKSFKIYSDSLSDQYFIGDYPTTTVWYNDASKYFKYANIRIFKGYNYQFYSSPGTKKCVIEVGELYPVCIACNGNPDPYGMCNEAGTQEVPASLSASDLLQCPQGQFYSTQCQVINIENCLRGSNANTCTKCNVGSTLTSNTCPAPTMTSHCITGTYECIKKYSGDYSTVNISNSISLKCDSKYYLDNQQCLACESSCNSCINGTQCVDCPANQFLLKATQLCSSTCDTAYKDSDKMTCIDSCAVYQVVTEDLKYCSMKCPNGYKQYLQTCLLSCPLNTFNENGICKSCHSKCYECFGSSNKECSKCNFGYYLLTTICEDFCADTQKFANQLENECTDTCVAPGVQYGMQCLYTCPVNQYEDSTKKCVQQCPDGYVAVENVITVSLKFTLNSKSFNGFVCQQCADGCFTCDNVDQPGVSENCIKCVPDQFLVGRNCDVSCPTDYPLEDSLNQRCLTACPPQFYQYNSKCVLKCPNGSYAYDQKCENTCPDGTYPEVANNSCLLCANECNKCDEGGPSNCIDCKGGYYLYDTICVQICPTDRKYHNTVTFICESTCPNYYLDDGTTFECYDQCPANFNVDGQRCTYYCSLGKYLDVDVCKVCDPKCARCDDGTNYNCTKCSANYYLDGRTCSYTCDENPTYYRSDYGYVCVEKCPGTLLMVDSLKKCVALCPNTHLKYLDHCLLECPKGYYPDINLKCQACPQECLECSSDTSCSLCAAKYFQQGTECLRTCKNNFYQNPINYQCEATCNKLVNNDGLGNLQCLDECPNTKVKHQGQCTYDCPDGYYKNVEDKICSKCSLECKTCNGGTNEDCIECQTGFQRKEDFCIGICPIGTFLNQVSCDSCAFRCVSCIDSKYNCIQCRGDRQNAPQCYCQSGYYDDRKSLNCQKCQPPCVTCQSLSYCLTCSFNLEPPDCYCKRPPPIPSDYCITCKLSFAESVRFSSDFTQIIVIFTYSITTNSEDAYFFSKENCQQWFKNTNFGESPICQQNGNKYIIQLGNNPTIMPNDMIEFKENVFIDNSLQLCQDIYIEQFNNTQLVLSTAIIPNVILSYPENAISYCMDLNVEVIKEIYNGGRAMIYNSWTTNSTEEAINSVLSQYGGSSYIKIPGGTMLPNLAYYITVNYSNFLGYNKTTTIKVMTKSTNPSLLTTFDETATYYSNLEIVVPFTIYSYSCSDTNVQELTESYPVTLSIKSSTSGTSQFESTIAADTGVDTAFKIPEGKLKASQEYLLGISVGDIKLSKKLKIGNNQLFSEFLTTDRIVGNKQFNLTVNASDNDVPKNLSKIGLSYTWTCINLYYNIPCRTTLNKPLVMTNNESLNVSNLPSGFVYQFSCTIKKESRSVTLNQQIIVSDLNMTEQIYNTDLGNKDILVVTDNLLYNLDVSSYYLVIIRYFKILKIEYIEKSVLRLNLYLYLGNLQSQQDISVIVGGTLNRYNLRVKPALFLNNLTVTPASGYSLQTEFQLIIDDGIKNDSDTTQYQVFVYSNFQDLEWDIGNFSNNNGYLLLDWGKEKTIKSILPTCKYLLVKVNKDDQFGMSYVEVTVNKAKTAVSVKNNIEFVYDYIDFNQTNLILDQIIVMELYFLESIKCNYNCWNRGECVNQVCVCDQEYSTFSDCSGILNDQNVWDQLASKLYSDLSSAEQSQVVINSIALLYQLSYFKTVFELTKTEQLFSQIDTFLQPQNTDTGIISQTLQSINYQAAFKILNFLSSLNKQLFTNDSYVTQMQTINQKLFDSQNTLILYTGDILLEGETQNYTSNTMSIMIEKKSQQKKRLLLAENLHVDSYFETNILRLQNNFPYPNHTQQLYYKSENQVRVYTELKKIRPKQKVFDFISVDTNLVCILSTDAKYFDDVGCQTSSQSPPITCTCDAGYVTLVDDYQYYYKPFYFDLNFVLDRIYLLFAFGGFSLLMLIFLIIGHIRDSRDIDTTKPILPGFSQQTTIKKVSVLNRVRRAQIMPSEGEPNSPSESPEKQQQDFQQEQPVRLFNSENRLSNCYQVNNLLGAIFLFKKNFGRKQRLLMIMSRVSITAGILGFIVNMQIIQLDIIILFASGISLLLRIFNVLCEYLNTRGQKRKQCIYTFFSYLITTIFLFVGLLISTLSYFLIYDRLVIYWGIGLACILVSELIVTDFILQLASLLIDYIKFRRQIEEDEEYENEYEPIHLAKSPGEIEDESKFA
ncbi:unnamed protein product [Paramecium primaurelia]|uniref:TNFR-Cys domain-containing protein n=1 Tax=Paramecium primaurelia TaxID=5886 RepID=A0A8S1M665_PARPR|nr:unnamed protein product [Paramecium primaurelia]